MKLRHYLKKFGTKEALKDFARRCDTSVGQLKQVAGEHRRAGESLAINIERESAGAVTCEELRPDVDWAYLRASTEPVSQEEVA